MSFNFAFLFMGFSVFCLEIQRKKSIDGFNSQVLCVQVFVCMCIQLINFAAKVKEQYQFCQLGSMVLRGCTLMQMNNEISIICFAFFRDQNSYFVVRFVTSIHKSEVNLYFWTLPSSLRSFKYELPCESATEW